MLKINGFDDRLQPGPKDRADAESDTKHKLEEFRRLYHRPEDGEPGEGRKDGGAEDEAREAPVETVSSIYSSLLSGTDPSAPSMTAAAGLAEPAAGDLHELVNGLVDQVLASPVEEGGAREVRLLVNANLLPDTEIRLSRGLDGLLSVTLITGRPESFQTLVAAQASLRTALSALENKEVRLAVTETGSGGSEAYSGEDGSAERRSRGHWLYDNG